MDKHKEFEIQIKEYLKASKYLSHTSLQAVDALAGDMSTRRFFRLKLANYSAPTVILMLLNGAPGPIKGGLQGLTQDDSFVELANYFVNKGLRVPRVLLDARQTSALIVDDVGESGMWRFACGELREKEEVIKDKLGAETVSILFKRAIDFIKQLQNLPHDSSCIAFKRWAEFEWYRTTIREFIEYYAEPQGLKSSARQVLEKVFDGICENIRAHPKTLAHFDFMAFNLYVDQDGQVWVLDFQDTSINSPVRDIISLINDRDMDSALGKTRHAELLKYFVDSVKPGKDFARWYNEYLLHWDFRVSGRFVQLAEKRGQKQYLKWVPGTLRRLGRTLRRAQRDIHGLDDVLQIVSELSPEIGEGYQDPWDIIE